MSLQIRRNVARHPRQIQFVVSTTGIRHGVGRESRHKHESVIPPAATDRVVPRTDSDQIRKRRSCDCVVPATAVHMDRNTAGMTEAIRQRNAAQIDRVRCIRRIMNVNAGDVRGQQKNAATKIDRFRVHENLMRSAIDGDRDVVRRIDMHGVCERGIDRDIQHAPRKPGRNGEDAAVLKFSDR